MPTSRAYEVTRKHTPGSGGIYFAESAGAARYDYLLTLRDIDPDATFADLRCRRAPEFDRMHSPDASRYGLRAEVLTQLDAQRRTALAWNAAHPIGTPVTVRLDSGQLRETTTRSNATIMCGHAVLWLVGVTGSYALDRVTPRVEVTRAD